MSDDVYIDVLLLRPQLIRGGCCYTDMRLPVADISGELILLRDIIAFFAHYAITDATLILRVTPLQMLRCHYDMMPHTYGCHIHIIGGYTLLPPVGCHY